MDIDFSETKEGKNIIKLKPETLLEKRVLLNFGQDGRWVIFLDADMCMVIADKGTRLGREELAKD